MAVDFSIQGIIDVVAQTMCGGSTQIAGLLIMMTIFFGMFAIFAVAKAPMQYAVAPMMILDIVFTALGIVNTTVSFLILVICAVMMARQVRDLVGGGSRWGSSEAEEETTACRSNWPSSAS